MEEPSGHATSSHTCFKKLSQDISACSKITFRVDSLIGVCLNWNHVTIIVFQNNVTLPLSSDCMHKFIHSALTTSNQLWFLRLKLGSLTIFWSGLVFFSMDSITSWMTSFMLVFNSSIVSPSLIAAGNSKQRPVSPHSGDLITCKVNFLHPYFPISVHRVCIYELYRSCPNVGSSCDNMMGDSK